MAYIVSELRKRNKSVVEASAEGETAYVDEVRSLAKLGARFYAECTPGYYNSEGSSDNRNGFFTEMYGAGPIRFFKKLAAWRDAGDLDGLELTRSSR